MGWHFFFLEGSAPVKKSAYKYFLVKRGESYKCLYNVDMSSNIPLVINNISLEALLSPSLSQAIISLIFNHYPEEKEGPYFLGNPI